MNKYVLIVAYGHVKGIHPRGVEIYRDGLFF